MSGDYQTMDRKKSQKVMVARRQVYRNAVLIVAAVFPLSFYPSIKNRVKIKLDCLIASPTTGLCVSMETCPKESYLNLASRTGSGHL